MTPSEVLAECAWRGIVLRPHESGGIWYSAPKGALTDDLREAIRQHKAELLRLLVHDSLDYRWDATTGGWVHERGWWQRIPKKPGHGAKVVQPAPLPPARGKPPDHPVSLALGLRRDGVCYVCRGRQWWLSIYGVVVCCRCHPPPVPELVSQYLDGRQAVLLARNGQR